MSRSIAALCGVLVLVGSSVAGAAGIRGDYIEARTADVFTGPCFSNAEVFIYGKPGRHGLEGDRGVVRRRRPVAAWASPRPSRGRRPSPRTTPTRPAPS